ncbi:MAG: 50S ribosomal protein L25 [Cyanobacteria bacterium SZAS LIN-5]|nr:50S ribosomal protein L25 [Cyanobacteria bacterium SZAS LIN-5]RTL46065.1 MAG: 50S ribosomal protein L25 [Candidatus Melainabacteria bacterium]
MEKIRLAVQAREDKTPRALRRDGLVPATLYGPGQDSESVQVDAKEFSRLPAAAYSHMIELDFGTKQKVNAVIRHVQRRNINHNLMHVEFYRVRLDRKLTLSVPLKFVGTSQAVIKGGQLQENFQEAEIESLPGDIPDFLEVDLSMITEIEGAIHFSDLKVADTIKILNPADEIIAKVVAPRAVAEGGAPAAGAEAAPAAAEAPAQAE